MKQKIEPSIKKNIANFFGAFGYLICSLQWFWVVMLYFSVVQSVVLLVASHPDKHVEQSSGFTVAPPNSSEMIILAIVTAIMIILTIYILIKIPMSIVKTGNKIVHQTAEAIVPVVMKVQHKKDTKKFRILLTSKLMLAIKSLLIILPVTLTAMSGLLEKQSIDYSIAMIISCSLACLGVGFFAIQYTLAGVLRIKIADLW